MQNSFGNFTKIIKGCKVYIRPPKIEELEYIKWLWADEETMKEVGGPIILSDKEGGKWYSRMVFPGSSTDFYCLIFDLNDQPLGEVSFHQYSPEQKSAEFNIKIAGQHRGKGYGKEATYLMLKYFFYEFGGLVMIDDLALENIKGQQALLKFGFIRDDSNSKDFIVKIEKNIFNKLYATI
ncbi:MAG: GNAT family N-acetyltransferase [Halanaerobiales bacterium]|nr:GNAT family N-acetyltransferase [Halanaerobiales bacterium]